MAKSRDAPAIKKMRPALTPEARENQLISAAMDLAEKQILEGTASSQTITHFLKLGSSRERLEKEKLQRENALLIARVEALESEKNLEAKYQEAIEAMMRYSGGDDRYDD